MKKMKKLFMALLVGMFMLPVMNATVNQNAALESLKIGEVTVDLTECTEKTTELAEGENEGYICEVNVPWNSKELSIIATAKSGASISALSQEFMNQGLDFTNLVEGGTSSFTITVEKTDEASTDYTINVTKSVPEKPLLDSLTVKSGDTTFTLDPSPFDSSVKTYTVTVPYSVTAVNVISTAAEDVNGAGIREVNNLNVGMTTLNIELTRGSARNIYEVQITREENPMIALIDAAIAADETLKNKVVFNKDSLTETSAQFVSGNMLDSSAITKSYSVSFEKGADVATIIAALKEAMKKDADITLLIPTTEEGTISDADIAGVKADGGVVYIPTGSDIIWVLDGSKITDEDKGFNATIKINDQIEKELYDKINKLLDPKDGGIIIDFQNEGKLPTGTQVMIEVEDYSVGDLLSLYYYNPKTGKLELYKKDIKVETFTLNGESANVVKVPLDHTSSYVLLPAKNNAQTGVLNVALYTIMALSSLAGIVFLLKKKAN